MVKNLKLLDKALQLLPEVKETVVEPLDIAAFLKPLKKGDSVEIDFGRHLVGHIKLKLGYVRSHPDAPVWLRFSFAENKKEFEERVEDYQGWICSAWVQQEQVHIDLVPGEYFLPRRYSFRYVKIEVLDVSSKFDLIIEEAKAVAREHHIEFEERHKKGDILSLFFEEYAEAHLIQPTFVMDHPVEISPLTKRKPENPDYVERFELFMNGWEMANAYSELNDPIDQRARFKAQEELLSQGDEEANTTDEDFMNALEIGMPPTGGIGFGIDRMVMLLTNSPAIRDVLLFPTMKSLDK